MLFEKKAPLNILICPNCKATGFSNLSKCRECRGMAMGMYIREHWLYWGYPLTRYHLKLEKSRRLVNKIRIITLAVLGVNSWFWSLWSMYRRNLFEFIFNWQFSSFVELVNRNELILFLLGVICFMYLWSRLIRQHQHEGQVEMHDYRDVKATNESIKMSWPEVFKVGRSKRLNIAESFTDEARTALGEAYAIADKMGHRAVAPEHLFYALLSTNRISNVFIRLSLPATGVKDLLKRVLDSWPAPLKDHFSMPLSSADFNQTLFMAYEEAFAAHQEYVSVTELLVAAVNESEIAQEILFDLSVDKNKLANAVEWARIRERLFRQYQKLRHASARRSKKGMDRAMTAIATPFLNRFSEDMTLLAQLGSLDTSVGRESEIEEIFRVIEGGQQNVLLVGDSGVGKKSIVEGLAQRMVGDDVPVRLRDKRLVRLSVSSLLAGTTPAGAVERLQSILTEIARAGNVILFIHNLHELVGVSAGATSGSLDVGGALAEFLSSGRALTIATTTNAEFSQHILNSALAGVFNKVEIREMSENQAIQVLESRVGFVEYKQKVFFAYEALEKAVQLCKKFIHEIYLPGSALEVMTEAANYARSHKGVNALVTGEEVAQVVAEKTKIPVTTVTTDESSKLMKLEEEMHNRVIGQDEAVSAVASALRRARANMRATTRPIANFLFLGPTGVGKTELSKTIAEIYFGGEDRAIRLDMSEYQSKDSIYRLIGAPGQSGTGILTEAVRRHPFSLLLLDEIEKADKDVLNLFLQVMDDGRLTDSSGRVIDFTNVILIATSNAGTMYVSEQLRQGLSPEAIKERLLHGELNQYFRPEFLNRFDGIIMFKPLEREDIKKIAGIMLKRVAKDLENKGVELQVEPAALEFLADVGWDPEFGARPMRRALQERVENKLAELLLSGELKRRDKIILGEKGAVTVVKA